jgi:hypothetical protein
MYLKTVLDLSTGSVLQKPITGLPAAELVNHETLWLKNFLSKQTQQTYRAVFREFCQLGRIAFPETSRQGLNCYLAMTGRGDQLQSPLFLAVKTGQNLGHAEYPHHADL